ncbi:double-strand-break repair protein rad21 homolog isoform X1 [Lucilia sericata]|uniref:double-strand-break repair protein rad21 homolog isoform X1 n=1 Tax=Lucilia sericata TaxID=13632 RepID=UPI0018A83B22|nr:double-strand-break repair protein rad21 homolog isoform X1 [Lucilia sericata]
MFYAHIILAKKGPLARVWLAAHWDKKITKAHVFETNIEKSVEGIMQPKVKLALRTSGHLLLGVVRIYSRKAKYLLADCNEAFVKIKMAFRPGMVDLPEGHREANVNAITLPEVFHDFDTALPELNDIDIEAQFSINQSRADEITMREDYGSLSLSLHDDGFGDVGFDNDTPDMVRGHLDSTLNDQLFEDEIITNVRESNEATIRLNEPDVTDSRLDGDGFGDEFGQPELFGDELFGEPPRLETDTQEIIEPIPNVNEESDDDVSDHFDARAPSPDSSCEGSAIVIAKEDELDKGDASAVQQHETIDENLEQSTLIQNEDESFALAPIDASAYKGITKTKRKRKLIVDEIKNISGEEMKAQLANTSDIVTTLDLAPPTKRWLMYWKETGGVEKLFSLPSRTIPARALFLNYHRHLISHFTQLEDFTCLGPSDILALEHISNDIDSSAIIQNKRGRKRKFDVLPNNLQPNTDSCIDVTNQSLAVPETIREQESFVATNDSLKVNNIIPNESAQTAEATIFDNCSSPGPLFTMNDISNIDNLGSLGDLAFTPGNLHHGMDAVDDFNHGGLTPVNLNHGHITPRHPEIETIESIPNLPVDQISSILNEAANMPENTIAEGTTNLNKSCDLASDWNDYAFPPSIEIQNNFDEQMENETSEQFEERVLNKRAAQLFYAVKSRMVKQDCLLLSELTVKNSRKQAAQKFYSLLVLKKFRALNISQSAPYSDIIVTRGQLFENPKL